MRQSAITQSGMAQADSFDVGAFIDRQPMGRMQWLVLALCTVVMMADGYDVFVLGFVLPSLAAAFHVSPATLAPVFAMQALGLALGNYFISPIADRIGRRTTLVLSLAAFGVITLITANCTTIGELTTARLVGGLFMASMVPNAIALTTEIAPQRMRGTLVCWMFMGYTGGAALGGGVAAFMIERFGWESAFWIGGGFALLLVPVCLAFLPESLRLQVQRAPSNPAIPVMLKRLDRTLVLSGRERFVINEAPARSLSIPALFRNGRAMATSMLWLAFFMNLMIINLLGAFLPTFLRTYGGLSLAHSAGVSSLSSLSGVAFMSVFGRFIDRFGASRVLVISYAGAFLALVSLGFIDLNSPALYVAIFFAGGCAIGAQGGLNALSATIYPTGMRATGVSWAFGAGRVGSIVAPLVGGWVLRNQLPVSAAFAVAAAPMLFAAASMLFVTFTAAREEESGALAPQTS